jgi:hypothetical protein
MAHHPYPLARQGKGHIQCAAFGNPVSTSAKAFDIDLVRHFPQPSGFTTAIWNSRLPPPPI